MGLDGSDEVGMETDKVVIEIGRRGRADFMETYKESRDTNKVLGLRLNEARKSSMC